MGLFKIWKEAKAIAAAGMPAGQRQAPIQRQTPQGRQLANQQHVPGMMFGLVGAMLQFMGPLLTVQAPERGEPLPGTDAGVEDSQDPGAMLAAADAVRARDAAFDPQTLTTFADQVFAAYSSMWGSADASGMRGLLADGIWEPLSALLGSGMGVGMGVIYSRQTGHGTLTGLWAGDNYDTARFRFAVAVEVPPDLGPLPKGILATSWTEDWLLQRSVKPGGSPMMVVGACPSCGAPTATDATGGCSHCDQPIPVLTSGWLVSRIRTHNPTVAMVRNQLADQVQQNPEMLAMIPDDIVKLLPSATVSAIDPQRAAALGLRPSR